MKKLLLGLCAVFITTITHAIDLTWKLDTNTTYAQTTCNIGDDIILPTAPTKYGYTFQGWRTYQPVKYLESTGTQYFNTGIIGGANIDIEVKGSGFTEDGAQIVVADSFNNQGYFRIIKLTSQRQLAVAIGNTSVISSANGIGIFVAVLNNKNFYVNEQYEGTVNVNNFPNVGEIRVFTGKYSGNQQYYSLGKIYYLKIWDNGTLVRDFIPVLGANGTPCMYDKVSGQFFYNAGTGDFIAGPAI